jgi:hypothetical protein
MADPKSNTKQTGDTHEPEIETDLPLQGGSEDGAQARPRGQMDPPGQGVRKAGIVRDDDAQGGKGAEGPGD